MTVIRKRTGDKGGCCSPYSELQLEIERVDQTAIDAKTTANNAEATVNANIDKINDAIAIVPQVQTNTENIAVHQGWLSANTTDINKNTSKLTEQEKDITALKTKTNDNATAIEALEGEIGPETVAGTIQYRLQNIDTKLPTAIKEVEMITDASTVTHKATHISGTTESDALPVVSREQAGIMSASVYAAMEDVIANNTSRISVLEQSALTYDISGLVSVDPTNAEISAAFQQKYPNIPIQPGIRVADYNNAHFWQYGNNMWVLLTQINVQVATNQSLGIVKGSDTDGKIFVETDGSMSLKGYDALVAKDATHDSKIGTLETGLGNANARIDATNTNVANNAANITTANGNISTNTNDINGLKGRMATAEGQIVTHETKIDQHTQSINGLTTDVNGLKTSKQDKLIAGPGITIENDGKTIRTNNGEWIKLNNSNDLANYVKMSNTGSNVKFEITNNLRFSFMFASPGSRVIYGYNLKFDKITVEIPQGSQNRYIAGDIVVRYPYDISINIELNKLGTDNIVNFVMSYTESDFGTKFFYEQKQNVAQTISTSVHFVQNFPVTNLNYNSQKTLYVIAEVEN